MNKQGSIEYATARKDGVYAKQRNKGLQKIIDASSYEKQNEDTGVVIGKNPMPAFVKKQNRIAMKEMLCEAHI